MEKFYQNIRDRKVDMSQRKYFKREWRDGHYCRLEKAEVESQQLSNCSYFNSREEMWHSILKRGLVVHYWFRYTIIFCLEDILSYIRLLRAEGSFATIVVTLWIVIRQYLPLPSDPLDFASFLFSSSLAFLSAPCW